MTTQARPGAPDTARTRPPTDGEMTAATTVAVLAAALGLLGFVNSFRAVARAAQASFGELAPTVPLGIDLAIAVFSAMDIVLARLDMRPRWVRLVPWSLTAVTIYLNAAGQPAWFGRVAHAVFPALWVVAVSLAAHVIRARAQLTAGTAIGRSGPPAGCSRRCGRPCCGAGWCCGRSIPTRTRWLASGPACWQSPACRTPTASSPGGGAPRGASAPGTGSAS